MALGKFLAKKDVSSVL